MEIQKIIHLKNISVGFQISKEFTTAGSANTCNFFCIFEKNTTTGSSHFLSPNGQGSYVMDLSLKKKNAILVQQHWELELATESQLGEACTDETLLCICRITMID